MIIWGFKIWQFLVNLISQLAINNVKWLHVFLRQHSSAVSMHTPPNARLPLAGWLMSAGWKQKKAFLQALNNHRHKPRGKGSKGPRFLPAWLEDLLFCSGFCLTWLLCFILTARKKQVIWGWHVSNQHFNPLTSVFSSFKLLIHEGTEICLNHVIFHHYRWHYNFLPWTKFRRGMRQCQSVEARQLKMAWVMLLIWAQDDVLDYRVQEEFTFEINI